MSSHQLQGYLDIIKDAGEVGVELSRDNCTLLTSGKSFVVSNDTG